MIKELPLEAVDLTGASKTFINSIPIYYFMDSDNLIINDGEIVGYYRVANLGDLMPFT